MILIYTLTLIISFSLTYLVKHLAKKFAVLDVPNERSSHSGLVPRGGGLAIVFTWFAGLLFLYLTNKIETGLFFALASVLPIVIIGILDDLYSVSAKIRLVVQTLSAIAGLYFLGGIQQVDLGFFVINNSWIINIAAILCIVWFTNLYNFLDGIDAYASMQAVFMAAAMYIFTRNELLLILMLAVGGFLFWNWPKAKIFMGDVGSTTLGYTLIILGIYFHRSNEFNFIYWLIISSIFWFDASLTLARRWKNRERISQAHRKHAYQRIVQAGYSHQKAVLVAFIINLLFLSGIYLVERYNPKLILVCFSFALLCNLAHYLYVEKRKPFDS